MDQPGYLSKRVLFRVDKVEETPKETVLELSFFPDDSGVSKVMDIFLETALFKFSGSVEEGVEGHALLLESYGTPGYKTVKEEN